MPRKKQAQRKSLHIQHPNYEHIAWVALAAHVECFLTEHAGYGELLGLIANQLDRERRINRRSPYNDDLKRLADDLRETVKRYSEAYSPLMV